MIQHATGAIEWRGIGQAGRDTPGWSPRGDHLSCIMGEISNGGLLNGCAPTDPMEANNPLWVGKHRPVWFIYSVLHQDRASTVMTVTLRLEYGTVPEEY